MHADSEIERAAALLRSGGLVAFPTETVYGLGANALDERAVARIFEVKQRPRFDPLIVHIAVVERVGELAADFPAEARRLAERFWPGPLTLVLPKRPVVPDLVTAGCPTVALRIPDHPLALALLRSADVPVAGPSANPFGRISPTTAAHVREQLGDQIDLILDGGPCRVGVESTVLLLSGETPVLLRPGGTTLEEIEDVVGQVIAPVRGGDSLQTTGMNSPGMLPQHYAPRTALVVRYRETASAGGSCTPDSLLKKRTGSERDIKIPSEHACREVPVPLFQQAVKGARRGLLTFGAGDAVESFAQVENLSHRGDLREAAVNFFAALRRLDAAGLDLIVADLFPETGLGRALNDRLRRAAHPNPPPRPEARS
jgi:L-threonylcarbamoyladenylate synthase